MATLLWHRNSNKRTLEIGAGTLNHLEYENLDKVYDIIEPKKFLFKNNLNKKFINKIYKDLKKCKNLYYERIISCAVLEHHTNLPEFLYLSSIKMNKKGYQSHSVPCEGYPTWDLTWFLINGIIFKIKYGYSFTYKLLNSAWYGSGTKRERIIIDPNINPITKAISPAFIES